ncbi:MAG: hypothetical protein ACI8QS_002506 [Planctomycetota bacterium]
MPSMATSFHKPLPSFLDSDRTCPRVSIPSFIGSSRLQRSPLRSCRSKGTWFLLLFIALGALALVVPNAAHATSLGEGRGGGDPTPNANGGAEREVSEVRAALVFKILRFVTWDKSRFGSDKAPLQIGVVGSGLSVKALQKAMEGKRYGLRPITFRHFAKPSDVRDCHLLYITAGASKTESLKAILARIPAKGVFVVGENPGLVQAGGVMNFYLEERDGKAKVRFEVNPEEAKRRSIKISSDLLKLARLVRDPKKKDGEKAGLLDE